MALFSQFLLSVHILAHGAVKLCSLPDSDTYVQHNLYISFSFKKVYQYSPPVCRISLYFRQKRIQSFRWLLQWVFLWQTVYCFIIWSCNSTGMKSVKRIAEAFEVSGKKSWKLCLKEVLQRLGPIPNLNSLTLSLFTTFHPRKIFII